MIELRLPPRQKDKTFLQLAAFGGLALLISCQTPKSNTSAKDSPTQNQSSLCKESWQKAKRALKLKKRARVAMAANRGTHSASLARQQRQNNAVGFYLKIPREAEHADIQLTQELLASVGETAVRIKDIKISPPDAPSRNLPQETTEPFDWKETDLLAVRSVTFFVESLTQRRFSEWYKRLPTRLNRMLILQKVRVLPGGHRVVANAYTFRNIEPPKHIIHTLTLDEYVRSTGIDPVKCPSSDRTRQALREEVSKINNSSAAAQDTLNTLSIVRLEGERFKAFERLSQLRESRSLESLTEE
jgi:hypothetical protein